jgi:hypothetical protein
MLESDSEVVRRIRAGSLALVALGFSENLLAEIADSL